MADSQNQDDDNIDDVANKAADIGKEVGVEDTNSKNKEVIPDYEIEEGDEEDQRVAKERNSYDGNRSFKKQTAKEKRDARKRLVSRRINEKDQIINQLQEQLNVTATKVSEFENRFSSLDKDKVDSAIGSNKSQLAQATADYKKAFAEGDGDKAADAMEKMYEAKNRIGQLEHWKQQNGRTTAATVAPANTPKPAVINKARAWAERHKDWYDPNGKDEDTEIAKSLSGVLANEGYDASTDRFWKELDKRLIKRGIIDKEEAEEEIDPDDEELDELDDKPAPKSRKRPVPPSAGGNSNRGGDGTKIKIKLPTSYVNTLKANGLWDDVPKRNLIIKGYLETRRNIQKQ